MDELGRIKTFIKVVKAGSFSAVGRHESSVSSVARQIRSLEDELGVRLLNRNTRSLSLTEPGRLFYERVSVIANELGRAKQEASSFQESAKGLLRVSLRVSAGAAMIVPALEGLLKAYPELTIDVTLTDQRCDLIAENIDVAVWIGSPPNADIVARKISPSQRMLCASPEYFRQHGTPRKPADLLEHNCILYTAPGYNDYWEFCRDGQCEKVFVGGKLRSDSSIALLSAALSHMGLIVVHEWMVRLYMEQGRLVRVLDEYEVKPIATEAELYVIYPSSRGLSQKVRIFVDFLVDLFNKDGRGFAGRSSNERVGL
ncbi:LysR family transcriptional regulator [Bordetella sp. 2513F-2]